MPAVIVENDTSMWADETGKVYHFPRSYRALLTPGLEVLYYKGKMTDKTFAASRLSPAPHYFGRARIGKLYPDKNSTKGDLFALIEDFAVFESAVLAKIDGEFLETIPPTKAKNYWRSAVRSINQADFDGVLARAVLKPIVHFEPQAESDEQDFESGFEGDRSVVVGIKYERDPKLRNQAIAIHGLDCKACGFDFEKAYGAHAKGFIHVHHVLPISEFGGGKVVNPETDLITLCANCHAVIHRKRDATLSVDELKRMLRTHWVFEE
jgi:putative restriction endonuclease